MFSGHKSDRKTESCEGWKSSWPENHRAAEPGKYLWKPSSPKLYSEQAQLNQVAQGHTHPGSQHHQCWTLHHICGQPVLVPDCPHNVIKKWGVFIASAWSTTSCSVTDYPKKSLSASFIPFHQVFRHRENPQNFLFSRLHSPSLLSLSSLNRCSRHLMIVVALPAEHPCLVDWGAQKWT